MTRDNAAGMKGCRSSKDKLIANDFDLPWEASRPNITTHD